MKVKIVYTTESDNLPSRVIGQPSCPHCTALYGMAVCKCGQVHCIQGSGEQACPWCCHVGLYTASTNGEGFDIGRGRG
ncbi:MAG: hypothetical protein HQL74_12730, partial [Magnetococcales bacterium]|nr:hypothetical protein [Magnetococcales bacterium]